MRSSSIIKPRSSKTCRRAMRSSGLLLSLVLLTGCVSRDGYVRNHCLLDQPIMISIADLLTDETAQQIETHNETWAQVCEG